MKTTLENFHPDTCQKTSQKTCQKTCSKSFLRSLVSLPIAFLVTVLGALLIVALVPMKSWAGPMSPSPTTARGAEDASIAKAQTSLPEKVLPEKTLPMKTLPAKKRRSKTAKKPSQAPIEVEVEAKGHSNAKAGKPSKLPSFKGTKKIKIDFSESAESHTTTVVVRTPLPLDQAIEDHSTAEKKVQDAIAPAPKISDVRSKTIVLPKEGDLVVDDNQGALISGTDEDSSRPNTIPTQTATMKSSVTESAPAARSKLLSQQGQDQVESALAVSRAEPQSPSKSPALPPPRNMEMTQKAATLSVIETQVVENSISTESRMSTLKAEKLDRRFYFKSGYLAAEYAKIERDLRNGATTLALGLGQSFGQVDLRASLEIGHGLDQSVTPENTRLLMARADVSYTLAKGVVSPFMNGGFGLARHVVRSYRKSSAEPQLLLREHLAATSMAFIPGAGLRIDLTNEIALETTLEYAAMLGTGSASTGGAALGAAIGWAY